MSYEKYFPLGLAVGEAFLGREQEQRLLSNNIKANRHTLLLSPRKYGKSSLVKHVIKKINYPAIDIDFFLISNSRSVESKILKGVRYLIKKLSDSPEHWLGTLTDYFRKINKQWTIGIKGFSLELIPDKYNDAAENILDALNAVEYVLKKKKQKAVLFIDEVQEIAKVEMNIALEGAIRHFAQEARRLTLIFSGSNRHMLEHMFGDNERPLYDLCERISVQRLMPEVYKPYLNKIAKLSWKQSLDKSVFNKIIELTECHPKTVYILCKKLWDQGSKQNKTPTVKTVKEVWLAYIEEKLKDTRNLLAKRSIGQVKLLTYIALGQYDNLTSKETQRNLDMTSSGIVQSLSTLEQSDYIERLADKSFRIIDPVLKSTLAIYNGDYLI